MKAPEINHNYYHVNNIRMHVIEAGPSTGTALLFLHGFPDFWYGWKDQIAYFATQGYHVIVPDQRGYNLSEKPEDVKAYRCKHLIEDICSLVRIMELKEVHLIGHDWGGIISWMLGIYHPGLFKKIIILNAPHPGALRIKRPLSQLFKSWYIYFFQVPRIPEWLFSRNNFSLLSSSMVQMALPGTFSKQDLDRYRQAWKGNLRYMINWYRAMRRSKEFKENMKMPKLINTPLLLLWGEKDRTLDFSLAKASMQFCIDGRMRSFPDATHWLQHEKSAEVNRAILDFLKQAPQHDAGA
jgi:pimeloyl-ACP methyl ester carboxylesterase